jgi:hypothetical protein
MTGTLLIAIALVAIYVAFLVWYGGSGKPLTPDEVEQFVRELTARAQSERSQAALDEIRTLAGKDDGKEFVMHNLVRYRAKALYPPGYDFDDDPRSADRRYARAIVWPLLRHGSLLLFVARRSGSFIEPEGADKWHYVAMVRYRSRRDFLRFALATERDDVFVHKWAAIAKTHVFPVKPLVSLFFVRGAVGTLLAAAGVLLYWIVR